MTITGNKIRNGQVIKMNGGLFKVLDFESRGTGKSSKFLQTKLRDLTRNVTIDYRFGMDDKIEDVELENNKYQYLYNEQDTYYFMDPVTFDQITVNKDLLGLAANYIKPETIIELESHDGNIVSVALPEFLELKVTSAPGGSKGGNASFKEVTLENGISLLAPHFINEGDTVRVDWAHNKYVDRVL